MNRVSLRRFIVPASLAAAALFGSSVASADGTACDVPSVAAKFAASAARAAQGGPAPAAMTTVAPVRVAAPTRAAQPTMASVASRTTITRAPATSGIAPRSISAHFTPAPSLLRGFFPSQTPR